MKLEKLLQLTQDEVKEIVVKTAKKVGLEVIEIAGGVIVNPEGKILLSSHMDTVATQPPKKVIERKGTLIGIDKKGKRQVLGGDDRAGVWIMLQLIKRGFKDYCYAFFEDEEVGCVGSRQAVKQFDFNIYNCFIGLDRRADNHVATYGYDNEELIDIFRERGYKQKRGSITDVAILSENTDVACVNLSVGFYNEHTPKEFIKIEDTLNTLKMLTDEELIKELSSKKFEAEIEEFYWWEKESKTGDITDDLRYEEIGNGIYYDVVTGKYLFYDEETGELIDLF